MPGMKLGDSETARRHSLVRDDVRVSRASVRDTHGQVGDPVLDRDGLALRGLLVRHLVHPEDAVGTASVLAFIAQLSKVDRPLTRTEVGLSRLDGQVGRPAR
jgi:putative pyruvate formate lyase activating enzyme